MCYVLASSLQLLNLQELWLFSKRSKSSFWFSVSILQSAGAVVFGWPRQLAIPLIFGYLAWVYLRPSICLFQFFSATVIGFSWPIQLAIALIFGCVAWVSLRQSMLYRLLQFFTAGAVGFSRPKQLAIALIVGCLAWVFLRP